MGKGLGTLKNLNILRLGQVFILLAIFSGMAFTQQTVVTKTKPHPKAKPAPTVSPNVKTPRTPQVAPVGGVSPTDPTPNWNEGKQVENEDDIPFEKSIEVDSKVNIGLCVTEGNIKINGWDRDEIRVFVNHGSKAGFRIVKKNSQNIPAWVTILGYDPLKDKGNNLNPCLSGDEIELDVPTGTILSRLEGREGMVMVTIESINKAVVKINEGDVHLRDIEQGVEVKTFEGDISVENSGGTVNLDSTNGNIIAYSVEPKEVGDVLKAKTNSGTVILQSSFHSVVEASSISGLIKFTGEIQPDGQYSFKNTSGQIILGIPKDSSCTITVISEKDKFSTDLQLSITNETIFYPSMKKLTGTIGDGEANISLQTQNGRITIKKIN